MRPYRIVGVGRRPAALQAAHYMGKVAAWQCALSGADFAEAERAGAAEHWSSVSSMHSTHEAERLSATPTPLVGCTHDSVLVRAATAAWHCSRLGGAQQLGEGPGEVHSPGRCAWSTKLCVCAQPGTLVAFEAA